ncbi:sensor of ECF-type sigma factor [Sabulilitoribacter arenilitoris]|uniref:Sensor of ECF-type sigma factor n=1 Tax=Wocania arenilitoris TaxID=2044858 RepID=A0AAE3EQZ1_9FLAO|nr:sensor of ECF-type sigma factor [Wocania arenilitoris]MCF7568574.1 sensor of ECF-type sigma factor [Wocania arenilitoris]
MKKILFILILLVSVNAIAQRGGKREKIKALKVAFITDKLNLTAKESQKFWPIYNAFEEETNAIRHREIRVIRKEIRDDLETMSEADANTLIKRLNAAENKMHKLRIGLSEKLINIIPAKKIIQLKIAEDDFRRKMLDELKKRKREKP